MHNSFFIDRRNMNHFENSFNAGDNLLSQSMVQSDSTNLAKLYSKVYKILDLEPEHSSTSLWDIVDQDKVSPTIPPLTPLA